MYGGVHPQACVGSDLEAGTALYIIPVPTSHLLVGSRGASIHYARARAEVGKTLHGVCFTSRCTIVITFMSLYSLYHITCCQIAYTTLFERWS